MSDQTVQSKFTPLGRGEIHHRDYPKADYGLAELLAAASKS
jgi:hypothetical protein